MPNILDALALASMEKPAQLQRIAALWCRGHHDREPYNRGEVWQWVKREFGPLFDADRSARIIRELTIEIRCQIRLRHRRRQGTTDPLSTPIGSQTRLNHLLQSRLGPARKWASGHQMLYDGFYLDGGLYSGLVAGLIPLQIHLRNIDNPNLLVYRYRLGETRTVFVANHIITVADAFIWLIPTAAAEFLQLTGTRVEHDGDTQTVRLITQFGTKVLPWRTLASP